MTRIARGSLSAGRLRRSRALPREKPEQHSLRVVGDPDCVLAGGETVDVDANPRPPRKRDRPPSDDDSRLRSPALERGDIRKLPNPGDGRSYFLVLTPRGQRIADRGWPPVLAAYERIARHLERPPAEHLAAMKELRAAVKLALAENDSAER